MFKRTQNYLLHILGSLLFLSIPILSSPDLDEKISLLSLDPFRREMITYLLLLVFFYLNYIYLIPQYYFARRYRMFFTFIVLSFLIIFFLPGLISSGSLSQNMMRPDMPMPGKDFPGPGRGFTPGDGFPKPTDMPFGGKWHKRFFVPPMVLATLFQFMLVFSLSFFLRVNRRLEDIQSEKLKAEVSYLKAQINPHFLFNTLNSLYALALEKSDAAPEAILKLSSMMRYVVTESGAEAVPLEDELAYLKNYVSLQRLRMDSNTDFTFIISGDTQGRQISPMLMIPFVENAFKYGINPEEESEIAINVIVEETVLKLHVRNKKVHVALPDEESGHGVENTRQRLEYLYPDRHVLVLKDENGYFDVNLKIDLV